MNNFLYDCTFEAIFKFYLTLILPVIKSTKKLSFEPKVKDQKIKLVCESSLLYFWKK